MFHKLHVQLTLFCTFVTGCIFLVLTFLCLRFAENSLKAEDNAAFLRQLNAVLIHLQEQDSISHQWLSQIQKNSQFLLYLYDNGKPLFYQQYHDSAQEKQLREEALNKAAKEQIPDIFSTQPDRIISHTEFDFRSSDGSEYYASAGVIPKQSNRLHYLILSPLQGQRDRIRHLRLVILLTDLTAITLLLVFFWFSTKCIIIPLKRNREKQVHFIATASHELRAPLAILRPGLHLLKKTTDPEEQKHFIHLMTEESGRMQNLIRDMLFLANADSRHLPLNMEICQPDELLLDSYEKFEPLTAGKNICLSLELPAEVSEFPDILCDRERIIQVFSILLDNALSYTPENGKIRLSLQIKPDFLTFVFADNGCGVPDDEKQRIFDRFYRSDDAHSGKGHSGLGLCIAREIVNAHHGSIWVEDAPERGSCFFVKLHKNPCSEHKNIVAFLPDLY